MATPHDDIPLSHLPLDVLQRLIAQREASASATPAPAQPLTDTGDAVDALLASVGLRTREVPASEVEPLKAELARRLNEGREVARIRAALYRSHQTVGLQEYRAKLTRQGLEAFIVEAGARLLDETSAPPLYLLVPSRIYQRQLSAIYNVWRAAIAGQPLVLTTPLGPLKVQESDLVSHITLV